MSDDEEYQMPPEQLAVWRSIDDKLKEQEAQRTVNSITPQDIADAFGVDLNVVSPDRYGDRGSGLRVDYLVVDDPIVDDPIEHGETDRYIDSFDGLHPTAARPWTEPNGRVIPTRQQLQQLRERMEGPMEPTRYVFSPQQWSHWQDQLQPMADAFTVMGQTAWDAASGLLRFAENIDPDTPPTDPRERALWLREHRNTGPHTTPLNQRRRTR